MIKQIKDYFEKRSTLVGNDYQWLYNLLPKSLSGKTIDEETSLRIAAVYSCVRLLSEAVASLPLMVYQKTENGKEVAESHPMYELLHNKPNDYQNSFEFFDLIMCNLLLLGNAYCFMEKSSKRVKQLLPLRPDQMGVKRVNNKIVYVFKGNGKEELFSPKEIWHPKGMVKPDGLTGYSVISLAREAMGIAASAEDYAARFYANDARPGGILSTPGRITKDSAERLKASWQDAFSGEGRSKVAVLEEGLQWSPVSMSNSDMQFIESRKFQINEIARIFRVPPHMIGDLERATFSNIEEQSIEFVTYCLRPWIIRLEKSLNNALFENDRTYFVEFKVDGLLRGNTQSRYAAYSTAFNNGWMCINEIRALENMNPVEGGDKYFRPLNLTDINAPEPPQNIQPFGDKAPPPDDENRGGPGSGNFGHAGRPGQVGGSAKGGSTPSGEKKSLNLSTDKEEAKSFESKFDNEEEKWEGDRSWLASASCSSISKGQPGYMVKDGDELVGAVSCSRESKQYNVDNNRDSFIEVEALSTKRAGYGKDIMTQIIYDNYQKDSGTILSAFDEAVPFYNNIGMNRAKKEDLASGTSPVFYLTKEQAGKWLEENKRNVDEEPENGLFVGKKILYKTKQIPPNKKREV